MTRYETGALCARNRSSTGRFHRARESLAMLRAELRLHPRPFAIAVSGAAVFALCTVGSSIAVQWVTDHVIVPRFDEGRGGRRAPC